MADEKTVAHADAAESSRSLNRQNHGNTIQASAVKRAF